MIILQGNEDLRRAEGVSDESSAIGFEMPVEEYEYE